MTVARPVDDPLSHPRLLAEALCADAGRLWDALLALPLLGEADRLTMDYALAVRNSATLMVAELARRPSPAAPMKVVARLPCPRCGEPTLSVRVVEDDAGHADEVHRCESPNCGYAARVDGPDA